MKTIEEKKRDRFTFMKALYDRTDGNQTCYIDFDDFGKSLGFEEDYIDALYQYLNSEGLISNTGITHAGIVEIEEAFSKPESATKHFPAVNLVTNHYHITGNSQSIIQTGNQNSASLQIASATEKHAYETLLPLLHQFLKELDAEREERAELEAEVQILEAQLKSPKPKSKMLEMTLQGILALVVDFGKKAIQDSGLYGKITQQIGQLLS